MKTRLSLAAFLFLIFLTPNVLSQDFIITCDKDVYACLRNCEAICNITNNVTHAVKINITGIFPNYEGLELEDILILKNVTYNITVPDYSYQNFTCYNSNTSTYGSWVFNSTLDYHICNVTDSSMECLNVYTINFVNDTCESYAFLGFRNVTRWKWSYEPFDYKWLILLPSNKKGIRGRHENGGGGVAQGSTVTVKFKFKVPISSEGKFDIEVKGDSGEYSLLDPWWNSNWLYRKNITINNTQNSNTLTDYQVMVIVDTQTLISDGKLRSDCGDIRFTWYNATDGTETEIPYWLESGCNTTTTKIWIKVPYIPANGYTTVYMYYGNPSATSVGNPEEVFVFYDDFSSDPTTSGKWTYYKYAGVSSEFYWNSAEGTLYLTRAVSGKKGVMAFMTLNESLDTGFYVQFDYRAGGGEYGGDSGFTFAFYKDEQPYTTYGRCTYGGMLGLDAYDGSNVIQSKGYEVEYDSWDEGGDPSDEHVAVTETFSSSDVRDNTHYGTYTTTLVQDNVWHNSAIYFDKGANHIKVYIDGSKLIDFSGNPFSSYGYSYDGFGFSAGAHLYPNDHVIDNVSLAKYVEPSPTYTIGAEETAEYISITLNYTSVDFGSLIPSTTNNPATDNGLYGIEIDTNCDARLTFYSPSTPLTYDTYTIPNENLKFNYTFDTTSYTTLLSLIHI